MFFAQFKYGRVNLMAIQVKRETPKRYYLCEKQVVILGSCFIYSGFVNKMQYHAFETKKDALVYLVECAIDNVASQRRVLSKTQVRLDDLKDMLIAESSLRS